MPPCSDAFTNPPPLSADLGYTVHTSIAETNYGSPYLWCKEMKGNWTACTPFFSSRDNTEQQRVETIITICVSCFHFNTYMFAFASNNCCFCDASFTPLTDL